MAMHSLLEVSVSKAQSYLFTEIQVLSGGFISISDYDKVWASSPACRETFVVEIQIHLPVQSHLFTNVAPLAVLKFASASLVSADCSSLNLFS